MNANVPGIQVKEVLGWKATDDGEHVLIGLKDANDNEVALAISPTDLFEFAMSALSAAGQTQNQQGSSLQAVYTFAPDWFEIGGVQGSDAIALTFYTPEKAALPFQMPRPMAERLLETLASALGQGPTAPPAGTKPN